MHNRIIFVRACPLKLELLGDNVHLATLDTQEVCIRLINVKFVTEFSSLDSTLLLQRPSAVQGSIGQFHHKQTKFNEEYYFPPPGQVHRSKLITRVRLEKEMAGLDTHGMPSCSSCSHDTEGQYRTCTGIFLANNRYFLDFLSTIYTLFFYYYEPNGV